jgi:hypothetical protein
MVTTKFPLARIDGVPTVAPWVDGVSTVFGLNWTVYGSYGSWYETGVVGFVYYSYGNWYS